MPERGGGELEVGCRMRGRRSREGDAGKGMRGQ